MATKVISRPNRRLSLPRELYQLMEEIAYFQEESISTEEFIQEVLMEIGHAYGAKMQEQAVRCRKSVVGNYINKSNMLSNPEDNNRFCNGINI
jgi:hypothetical protein